MQMNEEKKNTRTEVPDEDLEDKKAIFIRRH